MSNWSEQAIVAADREAAAWQEFATEWAPARHQLVWADLAGLEEAVVGGYDPAADLMRRAERWGLQMEGTALSDLAMFSCGLAEAEATAWRQDVPDIAAQAYHDRRDLLGFRVLHWAVPWLDAAARCYPEERESAQAAREWLLSLGDRHRPVPMAGRREGLYPPGEDSFGPRRFGDGVLDRVASVWGGIVVLTPTISSLSGREASGRIPTEDLMQDRSFVSRLADLYEVVVHRWRAVAGRHPGSAGLWRDLADRARETAVELRDRVAGEELTHHR